MAAPKKSQKNSEIIIDPVTTGLLMVNIVGTSPLICNAMSAKVKQGLVLGNVKKDAVAKAKNAKHDMMQEYRDSMYKDSSPDTPSRIIFPAAAFKKAMSSAALDIEGMAKAQIGRLLWVEGDYVSMYGTPKFKVDVVRCADVARTPDVRTRAIIEDWACQIQLRHVLPILKERAVINLLASAGIMRGVGDWRVEKGSGSFGCFRLVTAKDKTWTSIVKSGGRVSQDKAIESPEFYDAESQELFEWYLEEAERRGFKVAV